MVIVFGLVCNSADGVNKLKTFELVVLPFEIKNIRVVHCSYFARTLLKYVNVIRPLHSHLRHGVITCKLRFDSNGQQKI